MSGTVCPSCGHPNPPTAKFCESCARRLPVGLVGAAAAAPPTPTDPATLGELRRQRRYLRVAVALGAVGLMLGATAFALPIALPGYPQSLHPATPTVLYAGNLTWKTCTAPPGANCSASTAGNRIVDATIPGDSNAVSTLNLTVRMNRSCPECFVVVTHDFPNDSFVYSTIIGIGPSSTGQYLEAGFTNNSTVVGFLPGGIYDVILVVYVFGFPGTPSAFAVTADTTLTDRGAVVYQ